MSESLVAGNLAKHINTCLICQKAPRREQACEEGQRLHEEAVREAHRTHYRNAGMPLPEELKHDVS